MARIPGLLFLAVGIGLLASPWWSATLGHEDYALVGLLGMMFAGAGLFVSLPEDRAPRLRTFAFAVWIGAFGIACAAVALTPFAPEADGTYTIGGIRGFIATPMPWWARIIAGFFAVLLIGLSAASLWGLARNALQGRRDRPDLP